MSFMGEISAFPDSGSRPKLTLGWRGKTESVPDIVLYDVTEESAPVPARVERVLCVSPFVEPSALDICLGHWASWMRQDDRDLGVKLQAGIGSGTDDDDDEEHEGYDVDASAAAADASAARVSREIGMATNAMIESLDRHHKSAIYRRCNIASVWNFPKMDFTVELPIAERQLIEKLSKNVATRAFF